MIMGRSNKNNSFVYYCRRLSNQIDVISIWGAGILLLVNVGDIIMGVFMRYIFHSAPVWTEELARFTLIWMVMLAANSALYRGEHMTINIMLKYIPNRINRVLNGVRIVVFLGVIGFMSVMGFKYAFKVYMFTTMGLGITKTIPMLSLPVGMTLLLIQYLLMQLTSDKNEANLLSQD